VRAGAAAGALPLLALPWTRSVVRPGVPDFGVPLLLNCVASTTYQPGSTFDGTAKLWLILPFESGVAVASTAPLRLFRRSDTALAFLDA
jgi:hypothetical protein